MIAALVILVDDRHSRPSSPKTRWFPTRKSSGKGRRGAPAAARRPAQPVPTPLSTPAPPRQSYLGWLYKSLGMLYSVIFLGLSFALVAVFVMNMLMARRESILPPATDRRLRGPSRTPRSIRRPTSLAKNDDSFLGKVLSAGLAG